VTKFIEKEFSLDRLGDALKRLLNNPDPEGEGGHDHASPDPPTWLFGLRCDRSPLQYDSREAPCSSFLSSLSGVIYPGTFEKKILSFTLNP
jgi:hypothetical protein